MAEQPIAGSESEWFGHPRGLTILFLTQTWEQFSYYGMRTLLVYYMIKQLGMPQVHASAVYGYYTGFVYFTPIVGGWIADTWLGKHNAVILGGCLMAFGHFAMTFEPLLFAALVLIGLGNGFFLPSLPGQIPALYAPGDPRQTSGYSVYYVGVNLGAFLAPLICGAIGEIYGWHYGFAVAGIGMVIGIAIYVGGRAWLPPDDRARRPNKEGAASTVRWEAGIGIFVLIAAFVVLFRVAYEQVGNTVALWADTGVDRGLWTGWTIPMTWFQSLNPLGVLVLTPLVLRFWGARVDRGRPLGAIAKMTIGAMIVAAAYALLGFAAASAAASGADASWLWLFAFMAILTLGELFLLPVGLGLFGRLAPGGRRATMIALWFLAAAAGNLIAGQFAGLWSSLAPAQFFLLTAAVAATAGLLLRTLTRRLDAVERARA